MVHPFLDQGCLYRLAQLQLDPQFGHNDWEEVSLSWHISWLSLESLDKSLGSLRYGPFFWFKFRESDFRLIQQTNIISNYWKKPNMDMSFGRKKKPQKNNSWSRGPTIQVPSPNLRPSKDQLQLILSFKGSPLVRAASTSDNSSTRLVA